VIQYEPKNIHPVMNQKFDEIKLLFQGLYHEPFPSERGKETLGIDLVVLDCNLMGLASNYIGNHGVLNADEKILLRQYISELNKILFLLEITETKYFTQLHQLAISMLENINQKRQV